MGKVLWAEGTAKAKALRLPKREAHVAGAKWTRVH